MGFSKNRTSAATASLLGATALVAVVVLSTPGSAADSAPSGTAPPQRALDEIPGFGQRAESVQRDDTIALWEAYQRDQLTAACMASAGFTWEPEVLYPEGAVLAVAHDLGVSPAEEDLATADLVTAEAFNQETLENLTRAEQDNYWAVLTGEPSGSYELSRQGLSPQTVPGRESAESRGCLGQSESQVGRLWDLTDQLAPTRLDLRADFSRTSEQVVALEAEFGECLGSFGIPAASGIDGVSDLYQSDPELAPRAEETCLPLFDEAARTASAKADAELLALHEPELAAHTAHYGEVYAHTLNDEAFRTFLLERTAQITAQERLGLTVEQEESQE